MLVRGATLASILALGFVGTGCRDVPAAHPDNPDAPGGDRPGDAAALDGPIDYGEDGAPVRRACVTPNGDALSNGEYGRLDGILVAFSTPGSKANNCSPDADHLHLQIVVAGKTYDVAINVGSDVHSTTFDRGLFGPAWAEGWHATSDIFVEYTGLGIHSDTIPLPGTTALVQALQTDLATANHISVFGTGYSLSGAHLIHRNGQRNDGLVVTHPLAAAAHARAFSFTDQTF